MRRHSCPRSRTIKAVLQDRRQAHLSSVPNIIQLLLNVIQFAASWHCLPDAIQAHDEIIHRARSTCSNGKHYFVIY